jgi:hypothetical protein
MSFCETVSLLLSRCRPLLSLRVRTLLLGVFLIGGALGGMPFRPEEIEDQMQNMSEPELVQILEDESRSEGDPAYGTEVETSTATPQA